MNFPFDQYTLRSGGCRGTAAAVPAGAATRNPQNGKKTRKTKISEKYFPSNFDRYTFKVSPTESNERRRQFPKVSQTSAMNISQHL